MPQKPHHPCLNNLDFLVLQMWRLIFVIAAVITFSGGDPNWKEVDSQWMVTDDKEEILSDAKGNSLQCLESLRT